MKPVIVGIGEILWDIFPAKEGSAIKTFGGATTNVACHAQALGARGIPVSCIGNDDLGVEIIDHLKTHALTSDFICTTPDYPTGTVSVSLDASGNPSFTIHENVAWDYLQGDLNLEELAGTTCDAVCFGTLAQRSEISRKTIQTFLAHTRTNTLRIFDCNLRQHFYTREVIEQSLHAATILKLNLEELATFSGILKLTGDEASQIQQLAERYGVSTIALTKGSNGSLLYTAGTISNHTGYKTDVYDTVGAGDAFTAALTLGMLRGDDLETINDYANRVASFVCTCPGATPEIPAHLQIYGK